MIDLIAHFSIWRFLICRCAINAFVAHSDSTIFTPRLGRLFLWVIYTRRKHPWSLSPSFLVEYRRKSTACWKIVLLYWFWQIQQQICAPLYNISVVVIFTRTYSNEQILQTDVFWVLPVRELPEPYAKVSFLDTSRWKVLLKRKLRYIAPQMSSMDQIYIRDFSLMEHIKQRFFLL